MLLIVELELQKLFFDFFSIIIVSVKLQWIFFSMSVYSFALTKIVKFLP